MNAILLIVYGLVMFCAGVLYCLAMLDKYAPDLYWELKQRVMSEEE